MNSRFTGSFFTRAAWLGALMVSLFLVLMAGCDGGRETGEKRAVKGAGAILNVVATTMQTGDLVRIVGGDQVQLTGLMGPGIDPHQYKASAGDVDRLGKADLIVFSGLHLEAKMGEVLERLDGRKSTLAVTAGFPVEDLITVDGAHDPHVWFDVALWQLAREAVTAKLCELAPAHAADFRERSAVYSRELQSLHEYCQTQAALIPAQQRVLVTAHDAFNYFGRAYGLEVVGLQGISTVAEAGTGDVQQLAELIASRHIPAMFVETSVSPRAIQAVQEAVRSRGFEVVVGGEVYSDAMGDEGTPEGTYAGMLRHNIDVVVAALTKGGGHE